MSIRTASFAATYTTGVITTGPSLTDTDTYKVTVENSATPHTGIYSWDFSELATTYSSIINEMENASIVRAQLAFSYNTDDDARGIKIMRYNGDNPEGSSAAVHLGGVAQEEVATLDIETTNRVNVVLDLFDYNLYYEMHLDIAARSHVTLAVLRRSEFDSSEGSVEISGTTLMAGQLGEWRAATGTEIVGPPLLIVQYEISEENHPRIGMKYTTSDPTTNQTTPANSLGSHAAPNNVFPSAKIGGSISSNQTTIPIDEDGTLPTKTGLASVGPEVFKYTTIDTVGKQLTGVTRGIAPLSSFPAGFDAFRIPENIYYLSKDDSDIGRLFDTRPSSGLVQYRCIAIVNEDSGDDFNIQDAFLGIVQDTRENVQIHIGLEFPKHDTQSGTAEAGTVPTTLVDSTYSTMAGYPVGFFNNSFVLFPVLEETRQITSFSDGSFQFATVSGLGTGIDFIIKPAPAQTISNDATSPTTNSGRFTGFSEDGSGMEIELLDHGNSMQEYDLFYVWIRRTLTRNVNSSDDTGAVLLFRYRDI